MRGAWQIAALAALDAIGAREHVDLVVGSSAGAMNGCYFLAGQARPGVGIYVEYLTGSALPYQFVSLRRPHKIMDIDWLVDVVLRREVELDVAALRAARARMLITASDLRSGTTALFDARDGDLFQVLRASAALPVLYGRCPKVAGLAYSDGGLTAPTPVAQAVAAGATDVLVLSPAVRGHRWESPGPVAGLVTRAWFAGAAGLPGLRTWRAYPTRVNDGMRLAEGLDTLPGVHVSTIFASPDVLVSRGTADRAAVAACAAIGERDAQHWWAAGAARR